ncbi:hypothetical protein RhiirC2_803730 [Rhizophagus irregularis]|uniref:Uncharacterized protein n=1 Tax=Rhizophagus irregularis TaxID=588596 RepID=A0A2N1LC32_9GLOM|nr:hypothetical protein RhiirC2_803730 [Rhizophagus irregularis]
MSVQHTKSSCVLAKFITSDREVDNYPGQIQYLFKHTVDLPNGQMEHNLAYIRCHDCIIPVHNILCQFILSKYQISIWSNAIEYLAINPINRKLQIR